MKTITDVYDLIIKLSDMQIEVTMKHGFYNYGENIKYTKLPTIKDICRAYSDILLL